MLQQLLTIEATIEPLQDAILRLVTVTAKVTDEATLADLNATLEEMRKSDKELRDRLFVLQVARKYDWDAANKMARRKAGEYDDPDLAKVLEEREKRDEREKRRDKERSRSTPSPYAKRSRFQNEGQVFHHRGGQHGQASPSTSSSTYESRSRGYGRPSGFQNYRPQNRDEQTCNNCHQKGHFWKVCPNKK